jgi:hypothetical protein
MSPTGDVGKGQNNAFLKTSGEESGALPADLAEVVAAWATLSPAIRAAILAMVAACAPAAQK